MLPVFICVICGAICAAIASSKGRSPTGWFFIGVLLGLIGVIICAVLPNLKEQQSRQTYMEQENRRLREQIRQEQIKSETFRAHTQSRLDVHDQRLGIDTRSADHLLAGGAPPAVMLQSNVVPQSPPSRGWYYAINGQTFGPIPSANMVQMIRVGAIPRNTLVWTEGMGDWTAVQNVTELNGFVNT